MASVYDYLRVVAFFVICLVLSYQNVNRWMIADCLLSGCLGIALITYPAFFSKFVTTSNVDVTHIYLLRLVGCCMLASSVFLFLMRKSKGRNAIKSILLCRAMAVGMFLARAVYGQWQYGEVYRETHIWYLLMGGAAWLAGQALSFKRYEAELTPTVSGGRANVYFKYDALILCACSLPDVFIPGLILGFMNTHIDHHHGQIFALLGALNVATALLSWRAQSFRFNEDKRAVIYSRLMYHVLVMLCLIYGNFREGLFTNRFDFCFAATGLLPLIFIIGGLVKLMDRTVNTSSPNYNLRSRN